MWGVAGDGGPVRVEVAVPVPAPVRVLVPVLVGGAGARWPVGSLSGEPRVPTVSVSGTWWVPVTGVPLPVKRVVVGMVPLVGGGMGDPAVGSVSVGGGVNGVVVTGLVKGGRVVPMTVMASGSAGGGVSGAMESVVEGGLVVEPPKSVVGRDGPAVG
ncbi:hypothetical protein SFUMM280S_11282 [Streptomyces fumanus]